MGNYCQFSPMLSMVMWETKLPFFLYKFHYFKYYKRLYKLPKYFHSCTSYITEVLECFEVDSINSVQFSNHTQYKVCKGQKLNSEQLSELYEGLNNNNLIDYSHLLTGYVGDETFLNKLADIVQEMKSKNPSLVYLCDPVLGDNGKLYVPASLVNIYIERVLPLANIITPNVFELELIYGKKISNNNDVLAALKHCHSKGIEIVIVSSSKSFDHNDENKLVLYASSKNDDYLIKIEFDRMVGTFYGTGDAFAAMVLAWLAKLKDLKSACEHTISAMIHILKRTNESRKNSEELIELKLIQSKVDIENPKILVQAEKIPK